MAAAMDSNSTLWSYDIHVKMTRFFDGEKMDFILRQALKRYGLAERVKIATDDSSKTEVGSDPVSLLFVDGDHSYEGVRRDFFHWYRTIKPGGHILFHDSAKTREFTTYHEEVRRFVDEVERDFPQYFIKTAEVGSITHFVRTDRKGESFQIC